MTRITAVLLGVLILQILLLILILNVIHEIREIKRQHNHNATAGPVRAPGAGMR